MGVHYERWLIAKGASFLPAAASIVKLVERLRKEGWLPTGGYGVKTVENTFGADAAARRAASTDALPAALSAEWLEHPSREELRLVWPVDGEPPLPLKYPLSRTPDGPLRYALEIHRSDEYVYPVADAIGPVPTLCRCGEDQGFEWDDEELVPAFGASTGIFAECEACSRTFEPSKGTATLTNPFDGSTTEVFGGAAYRFALKVDAGTCFVSDPKLAFAPELVALVENEFGRAFHEVGAFI